MFDPEVDKIQHLLKVHAKDISDEDLLLVYDYLVRAYRSGTPLISDARFDSEFSPEFAKRFSMSPLLAVPETDLPNDVDESVLIAHPNRMLSMNKAYTLGERRAWAGQILKACFKLKIDPDKLRVSITPKLDGMACYDYGSHILSRGDSYRGEDITHLFTTKNIPPGKPLGKGPGELIVYKSFFDRVLADSFEHPRSYVVGVKNGKDQLSVLDNTVRVSQSNTLGMALLYYSDLPVLIASLEDFVEHGDDILQNVLESDLDVLLDGACGTLYVDGDERSTGRIRDFLGSTEHHHVWQLALKRVSQVRATYVEKVVINIGRTGKLTPVAHVTPVKVSGATISRLSLFNFSLAQERGIGPGAVIEVIRAGEVIPSWFKTNTPSSIVIPEVCPLCEHELLVANKDLYCPNTFGCPGRRERGVLHFFKTLDICDGFGPATLQTIFSSGLVNDLEELLDCTEERFLEMGFGKKEAMNLSNGISEIYSTIIPDYIVLAALGIESVGTGLARKIMHKYSIHDFLSNLIEHYGVGIRGISDKTNKAIVDNISLNSATYFRIVNRLRISDTKTKAPNTIGKLNGCTIVFTGTFTNGLRSELEQLVEEHGAIPVNTVTKGTSLVVYGDKAGIKLTKAKHLGVMTLSEIEFFDTFINPISRHIQE